MSPVNQEPPTKIPHPLILLPGLGGDAVMFSRQQSAFPNLIVPKWIEPKPREPLADYAARFAKVINPKEPCYLGGVSFGGVMALEVASHLNVKECFLISTIRNEAEMPRRLRCFQSISDLIMIPKWFSPVMLAFVGPFLNRYLRGTIRQVADADPAFMRWAAKAILHWSASPGTNAVKIFKIHGNRDWVFPIKKTSSDIVIQGAGHLLNLTRANELNQILDQRMNVSNTPDQ